MSDCDIPNIENGAIASDLSRAVRYVVTAIGGYLVGRGYLHSDTVQAVATIAATATPLIIGTILGRMERKKIVKVVKKVKEQSNSAGE